MLGGGSGGGGGLEAAGGGKALGLVCRFFPPGRRSVDR